VLKGEIKVLAKKYFKIDCPNALPVKIAKHKRSAPGLPDGLFPNQKSKFG
jgi:hypothetical protein